MIQWFLNHTWVKDKTVVEKKIGEVNKVASEALAVAKVDTK
jgi:hypothetical protein